MTVTVTTGGGSGGGGGSTPLADRVIAAPSGSDDYALIAAQATTAGTLALGPGVYKLHNVGGGVNTGIPLPGTAGGFTLQGAGRGATIIQLQGAAGGSLPPISAFSLIPTVNDQFLGDITLQDFTLDCNSIDSTAAALLWAVSGTVWRTSYGRIRLARVNLINVPSTSNRRIGVYIRSTTLVGDLFTQALATISDITVEDYSQQGGGDGVQILAQDSTASSAPSNVFIDRIKFKGSFYHNTGVPGGAAFGGFGAHVQIGQRGYCGKVEIDSLTGVGTGDVGLEVDNCRELHVGTVDCEDFAHAAVYMRNIAFAVESTQLPHQVHRYEKIVGRSVNASAGSVAVLSGRGNATDANGSTRMGDVHVGTLEYDHQLLTDSRMPAALDLGGAAVKNVLVDKIVYTAIGMSDASNTQSILPVSIKPYSNMRVKIGDMRTFFTGSVACKVIDVNVVDNNTTATLTLQVDYLDVDHQFTFTGSGEEEGYVSLVPTNTGMLTLAGYIKNLVVKHSTAFPAGSYAGIRFANTTLLTVKPGFLLDNLDFTGASSGISGREIGFDTGNPQSPFVIVNNVRYQNGTLAQATAANLIALGSTSGTLTVNLEGAASSIVTVTLTGNATGWAISNAQVGSTIVVYPSQDATGSRTYAHPTGTKWAAGTPPTITSTANAEDGYVYVVRAVSAGVPTSLRGHIAGQAFA